jgi:hypothetical protein
VNRTDELWLEADEALDRAWPVHSVEKLSQTAHTLVLRLNIQPGIFVNVFLSERSDSLSFALIKDDQRIFGIDRDGDLWHMHPYGASDRHEPLPQGLEPKPLLRFLARVEQLIIEHNLLTDDLAEI